MVVVVVRIRTASRAPVRDRPLRLDATMSSSSHAADVVTPSSPSPSLAHTLQDGRSLQSQLSTSRAQLKQADVRIAIMEDRIVGLQQVGAARAAGREPGDGGAAAGCCVV